MHFILYFILFYCSLHSSMSPDLFLQFLLLYLQIMELYNQFIIILIIPPLKKLQTELLVFIIKNFYFSN